MNADKVKPVDNFIDKSARFIYEMQFNGEIMVIQYFVSNELVFADDKKINEDHKFIIISLAIEFLPIPRSFTHKIVTVKLDFSPFQGKTIDENIPEYLSII